MNQYEIKALNRNLKVSTDSMLSGWGKSDIITLKRRGLSTLPCGTSFVSVRLSE